MGSWTVSQTRQGLWLQTGDNLKGSMDTRVGEITQGRTQAPKRRTETVGRCVVASPEKHKPPSTFDVLAAAMSASRDVETMVAETHSSSDLGRLRVQLQNAEALALKDSINHATARREKLYEIWYAESQTQARRKQYLPIPMPAEAICWTQC
ncbi:hypothetical protein BDP67DRAFT_487650 [Colletotrichum lupini]|nr:hypothetical protein BDP67DRAFT_487650 [Colletotrichum lupini]